MKGVTPRYPRTLSFGDHGAPVGDPTLPNGDLGYSGLEVVEVVGSEDLEEGDGGYCYFAYGSYDEGAGSLLEEVF